MPKTYSKKCYNHTRSPADNCPESCPHGLLLAQATATIALWPLHGTVHVSDALVMT